MTPTHALYEVTEANGERSLFSEFARAQEFSQHLKQPRDAIKTALFTVDAAGHYTHLRTIESGFIKSVSGPEAA